MKLIRAALACGIALAGCAVNQEKEVERYRKVVDFPATRPISATTQAVRPLTVLEAMWLANQQNERLSQEGENYLQAIIDRKRSLSLFLPTADLSGTYTQSDELRTGGENETFDVAAIGRISVFNGFRDVARLRISDLTIEQSRLALLDVQESLLADVVRAFYEVLRLEEEVRVLENTLKLQEERLRDVRGRQEAGVARMLDVSQSLAQVSGTRVRLIDTRTAVKNARAALAFLTKEDVEGRPLIEMPIKPPVIPPIEELRAKALDGRSDLASAVRARQANRVAVDEAFGQYYPSVNLNLRYFLQRETMPDDREWDAVLQASVPLFSAGQIEADVRDAWSRFRQAWLFETLLRRQILQDIETAYNNYQTSLLLQEELRVQVAAAEQAVRQAEGLSAAGLATNLERLVAQDQYLSAQLQMTAATYNQRVFYADLLRASGGLREWVETHYAASAAAE